MGDRRLPIPEAAQQYTSNTTCGSVCCGVIDPESSILSNILLD